MCKYIKYKGENQYSCDSVECKFELSQMSHGVQNKSNCKTFCIIEYNCGLHTRTSKTNAPNVINTD